MNTILAILLLIHLAIVKTSRDVRFSDYPAETIMFEPDGYVDPTFMQKVNELCASGSVEDLESFISVQNDIDFNFVDQNGNVPLAIAVVNKRYDMIKFLLGKGARYTLKDRKGFNALHYASKMNWLEGVQLLLTFSNRFYMAGIDLLDANGNSALKYAVIYHNLQMVQFLMDKGAMPSKSGVDSAQNLAVEMYKRGEVDKDMMTALNHGMPYSPSESELNVKPQADKKLKNWRWW